MPLETFVGEAVEPLLDQVRDRFGDDALVVHTRPIPQWDGTSRIELLAGDRAGGDEWDPRYVTCGNARELTASEAAAMPFLADGGRTPFVIALVGPTGAGKTTTIAKLVGHPRIFGNRAAGVISLDTYRVGAVEQLQTYADIVHVPLEIVYERADIGPALRRLRDVDVILVDTPGRGPRHRRDERTVDWWLQELRVDEVHVTLPAGMAPAFAQTVLARYRERGATHVLATKLDESCSDWTAFELAAATHMPMRWVTDGQEVPANIRGAGPRLLAALASARAHIKGPAAVGRSA